MCKVHILDSNVEGLVVTRLFRVTEYMVTVVVNMFVNMFIDRVTTNMIELTVSMIDKILV